jgi:DNA-directed RNA polymerase specialized sigma24 family protein
LKGVIPFQRVLDDHRDAVWRLCVATAGRNDADDAFQETWMSALRAYPRLAPGSNVRAWLLTIAHRKAIDTHRARARRPVVVGAVPDVPGPAPADEGDDVWAAVRELPQGQRAALTLRYAADLTHAETAELLGITTEAVRRRVADGLNALRGDVVQ